MLNVDSAMTPTAYVTLIFGLIGGTGGAILWFTGRISALGDKEALDIGALRMEFAKDIERIQALEADARHRLANETQRSIAEMQTELRRIRETSATKGELDAVEHRLSLSIGKVEARIDRIDVKLEPIPAIQTSLLAVQSALEKISAILSQKGSHA